METSDFNWLTDQSPELYKRYSGKWIAVLDKTVIGVGDTATEAAEQARKARPDKEFILEAVDTKTDVIYGGL